MAVLVIVDRWLTTRLAHASARSGHMAAQVLPIAILSTMVRFKPTNIIPKCTWPYLKELLEGARLSASVSSRASFGLAAQSE